MRLRRNLPSDVECASRPWPARSSFAGASPENGRSRLGLGAPPFFRRHSSHFLFGPTLTWVRPIAPEVDKHRARPNLASTEDSAPTFVQNTHTVGQLRPPVFWLKVGQRSRSIGRWSTSCQGSSRATHTLWDTNTPPSPQGPTERAGARLAGMPRPANGLDRRDLIGSPRAAARRCANATARRRPAAPLAWAREVISPASLRAHAHRACG